MYGTYFNAALTTLFRHSSAQVPSGRRFLNHAERRAARSCQVPGTSARCVDAHQVIARLVALHVLHQLLAPLVNEHFHTLQRASSHQAYFRGLVRRHSPAMHTLQQHVGQVATRYTIAQRSARRTSAFVSPFCPWNLPATTRRSLCLSVTSPRSNCSTSIGTHLQTCNKALRIKNSQWPRTQMPQMRCAVTHLAIEAKACRRRQCWGGHLDSRLEAQMRNACSTSPQQRYQPLLQACLACHPVSAPPLPATQSSTGLKNGRKNW